MLIRSIRIREYQRGLLFRGGDFVRVLRPGRSWVRTWLCGPWSESVEILDVRNTAVDSPLIDFLVRNASFRAEIELVELAQSERALVWKDDRVWTLLGPGRYAFFKEPYALRFERFDVGAAPKFEHDRLADVLGMDEANYFLDRIDVPPNAEVLVFRDGRLIEQSRKGPLAYWRGSGEVEHRIVDLREQVLDVAGQEIMTRDKVSLRVNLVVAYRVTDPLRSVSVVKDAAQALYRDAQLVLRAAVGTRDIDVLLGDKESVGGEVANALTRKAAEFGVEVRSVGLKDIVLPGDMKTILNQVITAQKQAEANLIRRREETAAARSQANTARPAPFTRVARSVTIACTNLH